MNPFKPRGLTPGERKYMVDAARGLTIAESAAAHGITAHGVVRMREKARRVLGARNIAHAVALAILADETIGDEVKP